MCIELDKIMMHERVDVAHDDVLQRLNKARRVCLVVLPKKPRHEIIVLFIKPFWHKKPNNY